MSYIVEYAHSVHSAFRAPNNFCHDLQHVMRGAVKNLSQTCLLTNEPEQLARYQVIYASLQHIIETNTTMSERTIEQSETLTMMESAADYLAASATSNSLSGQQHRTRLSATSFKSSDSAKESTFASFDKVGQETLGAVLPPEMVVQLSEAYNTATRLEAAERELRELTLKVQKYAKHKKTEKLLVAQQTEENLNVELTQLKGVLQEGLSTTFPAVYKRVLREYIDICQSLLHATQIGSEILMQGSGGGSAGAKEGFPAAGKGAASRQVSVALTVDALEAHEALEEVKQEMQHHGASKTPEQVLHDRIDSLLSSPPRQVSESIAAAAAAAAAAVNADATKDSPARQKGSAPSPTPLSPAPALAPPAAATTAVTATQPGEPHHSSGDSTLTGSQSTVTVPVPTAATPPMAAETSTQRDGSSQATIPHTLPKNGEKGRKERDTANEEVLSSEHAEESVAPSLACTIHAHFPFWFRYFYFDRLANSTERLAIAFGLYVSYCKRLARKSGYTIPLPIRKHMDRMEMEFTTARYARHKREFQTVLKDIFNYRKNLEVMETYVRLARNAEAHVQKHTKAKNKKGAAKWSEKLATASSAIEEMRVEIFGRGAEEMIQFYDQLLQCIRGSLSDLIITLGGSPE